MKISKDYKKLVKNIKTFLKQKKKTSGNISRECYKCLQEDEKNKLVEYGKNIIE